MSFDGLSVRQRDLVFLDVETTGTNPDHHEVIEMAAIKLSSDLKTEKQILHRKCRMQWPERADAKALEVNHYAPTKWANALPIRVALVELASVVLPETIVLGWNVSFDVNFLKVAYEREKLPALKAKYFIDAMSIAFPLALRGHLEKMSLEHACTKYGVSNLDAHGALVDVQRLIAVFKKMVGAT